MRLRTLLWAAIIFASANLYASAQTFEISSQSGYVYFPSPEGPGIPECMPNAFRCDFGISGSLTVSTDANTLSFTAADFTLVGNQAAQANRGFTGEGVSTRLVIDGQSLPLISDAGGVQTYEKQLDFATLRAIVDGDELRVTGGRDGTPFDGDGYTFDLGTTLLVPEPTSVWLCSLGVGSMLLSRRRR